MTLASASAAHTTTGLYLALVEEVMDAARELRDRVSRNAPLKARHVLAVLLRYGESKLSAAGDLQAMGDDIDEIRRILAQRLANDPIGETYAAWVEVLTGPSGFDIANRATTDFWTRDDALGYAKYAQAIADSTLFGGARPPLTVAIQAPWV
jgi:hypothetical protein